MTDWLAKYQGWHRDVTTAIAATDDVSIIAWGLFACDPLPTIVEGRVALMGGSAHPVLPFMGQSAAMAIKDGVMLDRVFAEVTTVAEALGVYEAIRKPRTDFIQHQSITGADRLEVEVAQTGLPPAETEDSPGIFHFDPANAPMKEIA